uniref:EOG090X0ARU n=1 Tax=Alona affinis TaxID=381656 RepID=A0A9N6WR71_9CRUS|nr:EOG090X0ARU [Alona affinis]
MRIINLRRVTADDKKFQSLIVWLEDQKIRRYKIEEREPLRNSPPEKWNEAFVQYLTDLDCPFINSPRPELIDWLLGLAVQLEFSEKQDMYTGDPKTNEQTSALKTNPLDNLDFESNEFKQGVNQLADVLQIPKHPNHLITLEGVCSLLKDKFSEPAVKNASQHQQTQSIPIQFDKLNFGMNFKDPNFSQAANVLRFLFIHDLRNLQTKINECLVSVQALTANPKTDTTLGKVGH